MSQSLSPRAVLLTCVLGLNGGCISTQDVGVAEPNDRVNSVQEVALEDAGKHPNITLASDANWEVYSSRNLEPAAYLGQAQPVCASVESAAECPNAVLFNVGSHGWSGRIDACEKEARWIWAPGIVGTTAPSEMAQYYFVNHVTLASRPASAKIRLAVDDQAEILINGTAIATIGSTTDKEVAWASQINPSTFDIASALVTGPNTIVIRAANGSGAFSNCTQCTYRQNPAGVVFCIDVRY